MHGKQEAIREFKQTSTGMSPTTPLNNSVNKLHNETARANTILYVRFFAVGCKATTRNDQFLGFLENVSDRAVNLFRKIRLEMQPINILLAFTAVRKRQSCTCYSAYFN